MKVLKSKHVVLSRNVGESWSETRHGKFNCMGIAKAKKMQSIKSMSSRRSWNAWCGLQYLVSLHMLIKSLQVPRVFKPEKMRRNLFEIDQPQDSRHYTFPSSKICYFFSPDISDISTEGQICQTGFKIENSHFRNQNRNRCTSA